jgi:hypothetical protein
MKSFFSSEAIIEAGKSVISVMSKWRGKFSVAFTDERQLSTNWLVDRLAENHRAQMSLEYDISVLRATLEAVLLTVSDEAREGVSEVTAALLTQYAESLEAQYAAKAAEDARPKLDTDVSRFRLPKGPNGRV